LDHFISLSLDVFTPDLGFILDRVMGSKSFVESFVAKAFHEDFGMIFNLIMIIDP
jgi:hypothetical protein